MKTLRNNVETVTIRLCQNEGCTFIKSRREPFDPVAFEYTHLAAGDKGTLP